MEADPFKEGDMVYCWNSGLRGMITQFMFVDAFNRNLYEVTDGVRNWLQPEEEMDLELPGGQGELTASGGGEENAGRQ
jgi:hypothetical protein